MRSWLSEWLRVVAVVALLGSVLWLLTERDVSLPALLRSAVWGLVVWVWGGLVWIALQYGQGREDRREQRGRIDRVGRREMEDEPQPLGLRREIADPVLAGSKDRVASP